MVHRRDGDVVMAAAQAGPGVPLAIRFHDGEVAVTVDDGPPARTPKPKPQNKQSGSKPGNQGSLF
jgi:hypothetical protein